MKRYTDDIQILLMAEEDGCAQSLRDALAGSGTSCILAGNRAYIVSTTPGDCGFCCFEVDHPLLLLPLVEWFGRTFGPMTAGIRPNETLIH